MLLRAYAGLVVASLLLLVAVATLAVMLARDQLAVHQPYAVMLIVLTTTALIWRARRPTPRPLLRWYAGIAGAIWFAMRLPPHWGHALAESYPGFPFTLDASLLITACLVFEMVFSSKPDDQLATAVARIRRVAARGT